MATPSLPSSKRYLHFGSFLRNLQRALLIPDIHQKWCPDSEVVSESRARESKLVASDRQQRDNMDVDGMDVISVSNGSKLAVRFRVWVGTELEPLQQVLPHHNLNRIEPAVFSLCPHFRKLSSLVPIKYFSYDRITI